jgi:hypothetical protein
MPKAKSGVKTRVAGAPVRINRPLAKVAPDPDVAKDYLIEADAPEAMGAADEDPLEDDQASASVTQQLIYRQLQPLVRPARASVKAPAAKPGAGNRKGARGKASPR